MRTFSRLVACLFICGACSSALAQAPVSGQPQRPGGVVVPVQPPGGITSVQSKRQPPFIVRVKGTDAPVPKSTVKVHVTIERNLIDSTPLHLEVKLPEGVTLIRGQVEEAIVDAQSSTLARTIELRIGAEMPVEDVVVIVSQRGDGWGAHAEHAYRFGRPEPDPTPTLRRGEPIDLGNGTVVRPVIVD